MKILIADDELVSIKKLDRLVRSLGYETIVASDGQEAWETWKNERPRMVITDWMMPRLDGLGLCKKIRKVEGNDYTYIIMVTSREGIKDMVTSMNAGMDDFITKPFEKRELAVRIKAGERMLSFITRDMVIFAMAKLAESRDPETGNHLERMRFYSKTLAETLARVDDPNYPIDELFIDNIFLTSPLHDIGKIGIPDYVLLKPGRFDDSEFNIIKKHCCIGFETIKGAVERYPKADYLKMSSEIALYHHEKFAGTGYPNRLKGKEIPLSARIVALADSYDAIVSKRVYKSAKSHDMARAIIAEDSNKHFDPMVVNTFFACEDLFIKIFNKFKE